LLVGVRDGDGAGRALDTAVELGTALRRSIIAVHVVVAPRSASATTASAAVAVAAALEELADACHLSCELALAGAAVRWSFERRSGDPAEELRRRTLVRLLDLCDRQVLVV
jgi:nucleotide-binding universal stress UspA family protein